MSFAVGQGLRGESNASAKLTEQQVMEIRSRKGVRQKILAYQYGVSLPTISAILRRRKWAWLEKIEP